TVDTAWREQVAKEPIIRMLTPGDYSTKCRKRNSGEGSSVGNRGAFSLVSLLKFTWVMPLPRWSKTKFAHEMGGLFLRLALIAAVHESAFGTKRTSALGWGDLA